MFIDFILCWQGMHLLSGKQRRDTFYKYEKRIRELSTQEKAQC